MSEGNGLPKGWGAVSLADLTSHRPICYGVLKPGQRQTHGVPLIRITDISADVVDASDIYLITDRLSKAFARSILRGGEVLLSIQGTIGRTAICPQSLAGANVSRTLAVIDPDERVDRRFLRFWCLSRNGRFPVCGSTRASLNIGAIRELVVPIAPLPEQHRIVEKIEELFSDLDAGVASLERAKANLKRYRASVLKSAVEGRLTEEWRKEHPQAKAVLGTSPPSPNPTLKKRAGRLWGAGEVPTLTTEERSRLPNAWLWTKVRDLGPLPDEVVQVGPMSMRSQDFESAGVPVLNVGCVQWGGFNEAKLDYMPEEKASAFDRYRIRTGDILFTRSGTVGRSAVALPHQDGWLMTFHLLRVRCDHSVCNPVYLQMVFQGASHVRRQTREASVGSTRAGFNTRLLADLDVPLPPLAEQEQIVALVEERLSQIDSAEKTIDAELIRSKRLRQSILKTAFEGKLVPQDPQDEPASVLLERIKATREAEQPKKRAKKVKAR